MSLKCVGTYVLMRHIAEALRSNTALVAGIGNTNFTSNTTCDIKQDEQKEEILSACIYH